MTDAFTTTDEALTEQIARATCGSPSDYEWRTWGEDSPRLRSITLQYAARLLPIIRKAQADAWDEGQESGWGSAREESDQHGGVCDMWKPHVWLEPNPYREEQNR